MEDKEILEGNKLIAEFMGSIIINETVFRLNIPIIKVSELQYHKSWNFLMPIVEEISADYDFSIQFYDSDCIAYAYRRNIEQTEICSSGNFEPHILNVWKAVIGFIKWYNLQNNEK